MASEPIMWSEIERSPQFSEATPEQKLQSLDEWTKGALSLTEDQQQRELFEAFADREKRKLLGEEVPDVKVKDYLPIYRERKRQEAVDQQGLLSQLGGALATGTEEVLTGLKGTAAAYTGDTKALAESLAQTTALQQEKQLAKTTEDIAFEKELEQNAKEFEQAKGFWPTAKELLDYATITAKNPSAALKMGLSSAPNAIVSFGGQILGRAAGAATGAALAGAPTLGAGAIPGAVAGLFGGGMVTNAVLETQPQIYESLIKATEGKAEQMDANQIQKLIEEKPEIVSEGLKKGATRGAVIGAVESLFTKGASRLLSVTERAQAKAVSQLAKNEGFETAEELLKKSITDNALKDKIVDVAARAAIPLSKAEKAARSIGAGALGVVGEGAGEAAAMAATGEKLDPTAIYQEMLGAGVMAGGEVAVLRGLEKSASVLQKLDKAQSLIDQSAPVAPSAASAAQAVANEAATASAASIVASAPAPADRAAEIQSRLAEIEKEFGPRQKATLAADGTPSFQDARVNTTEEDALLKELSALNQAPAVAPAVSAVAPATAVAAVSAGIPASAPAESIPSKPTVSIANSPSPNLVPRATENAPPRPVRQTGESREQFVARLDEWDANYAKTHNADGTPYQPTVLDETVGKALAALKGKSFDDRIDAIGSDINLEMGSYLAQLLNDGWVWDDATGRMVDPQNRGETPIEALARIKRKAATPVEAVTPDPFSTTPQPQTTPTNARQVQVQEASGLPPVEGQPSVQPPAVQAQEGAPQRQGEGQEEVTQTALKAVATNTATPGQVASLEQQGLARVVRGQPVITEAGIAKMPEQDRPALTEAQRVAEIEAAPETAQGASPAETNGQAQDQQTAATEQLLGSVDQTEEGAQEEEPPTQEQIAKGLAYVESMIAGIKGVVIYDRLESLLARTDLSEDEKNALREARTQAIYSNGRAIIATDKVRKGTQYTSLDKAIAAVVFHELMHYGSDVLRNSQDMAPMYNSWVNMLKENVTNAMIDGLVTNAGYVGFADWATNPESKLRAMEEIFVRQLTDLYNRKGSLSLQEESLLQRFMNWIKNVVNTAIGTDFKIGIDDKILNDWGRKFIRAVSSSVNVANANSNAAIMRSLVGAGLITPAMDAEYLAAVEAGDMEKAQRMVDEAAKRAGYTVKAWHGTWQNDEVYNRRGQLSINTPFTVFDMEAETSTSTPIRKLGFFFGSDRETAEIYAQYAGAKKVGGEPRVISAFLNLGDSKKLPFSVASELMNYGNLPEQKYKTKKEAEKASDKLKNKLETLGYNSIIFSENNSPVELVVFNPSQIKSADPITRDDAGNVIPLSQRFQEASPDIRRSIDTILGETPTPRMANDLLSTFDEEERKAFDEFIKNNPKAGFDKLSQFLGLEQGGELGRVEKLAPLIDRARNFLGFKVNKNNNPIVNKEATEKAYQAAIDLIRPNSTFGKDYQLRNGGTESAATAVLQMELAKYALALARKGDQRLLSILRKNWNGIMLGAYITATSAGRILNVRSKYVSEVLRTIDTMSKEINKSAIQQLEKLGLTKEGAASVLDRLNKAVKDAQADEKTRQEFIDALEKKLKAAPVSGGTELDWIDYGLRGVDSEYLAKFRSLMESIKKAGLIRKRREEILAAKNGIENSFFDEILGGVPEDLPTDIDALDSMLLEEESKIKDALDSLTSMETNKRRSKKKKKPATPTTPGEAVSDTAATDVAEAEDDSEADKAAQKVLEELKDFLNREYGKEAPEQTVYDVIKERVKIAISNPDGNPANVFRKDLEQALSGFDIKPELLEDLVATSYTTYARYVQKDAERIAEKLVAEKVEGGSLLPNEVRQLRDVVKQAIANKDKLTKDAFDAKYLPLLSGLGVEDGTAITIVDAAFAKNQEAAAKSEENRKARLQEDAKALTDSLLGKAPKKVPAAKVENFRTVVRDFLSNPSNLDEAKFINQLSTKLQTFGLNQPEATELARAAFKKSVEIQQDNLRKAEESFDKGVQGILDNLTGSAVSKASTAPTILGQIRKIIGDAVKNADNLDQAAFEAKYSAELAPLVNDANRVKELVKASFDKFSQLQSKKEEDRAKAFTKDIQGIIDTLTGSALPKKKAPPTVIGQIKKIIGEAVRNKDSLDQAAFETKYTALFEPLVGDKTRAQELAKAAYAGSVSYKQSAISKRADRAKSALLGGYRSRMVANIQAKATPEQMADFAWRTEQMMNLLSSMGYTEQESVDILSKFSYEEIEQVLTNNINPNLAQDVQSRQAAYAKLFANRYEKELDAGKNKDDSRIRMANLRGLMKSQVKVNLPKDVFLMEAMKFGASAETAEKLYNLTERERNEIASDDTKKLPTKFGKLIDYILKNPSLMNDDASRDAAIEGFLRDNGFDEAQISSILPWILPMASDYINMAKAKAMQAELDSLDARRNKSEKLKAEKNKRVKDINEMSDEAYRKLKKTLETIRKGIAFVEGDVKDPSIKKVSDVASALAKENGFSGFLPSDYQALAELDLKITSAMADGRPHDSAEGLRELYELLSRRSAPRSLLEFVSIVYNNNALGGLSTLYINIIAPFGEFITKVIIDAGRALLNRDFNQAFISIRAMIDSFKKAVKEGAFGLEGGASVVAMSQQVQKVTTLQGDVVAAQKVWNDKKASKLQKLAAGYTMVSAKTDIIRRVLSTTDHVAFTTFQNYLIKTRANDLLTKHLGMKPEEALPFLFSLSNRSTELIKAETGVINDTIQKLSDVGFDYEKSLQILEEVRNDPSITEPDLVQFTQDLVGGFRRMVEAFQTPEKIKRNLVREARRQKNIVYLRANDRNNKDMLDFLRGEFIKGGKAELVDETLKNFNNFVQKESEYVMGVHGGEQAPGLDVINLFSNQIVKAGEAVIRSNPLVGRMLLGYFKIPVNLLNRAFWFTPYGLIRLGINKWGNKAGEYYQQSMNTQAQIRQRFTEAIVGTSAMVALFILQGMADDDEEFVVTLAGPTNKTEKDAYRKMGYRDGSIALKTGGKVYSLNWARGPLESFKIALMLVGAVNDMKLNRKLGEKKGFDISEYLSAVMYGWSRQASFFGAKSTIGATLAIQPDASLIGQGLYKLNPLVPFSGLINSVEKIIAGPDLYRSGMGAVYANIPIARSLLTERAVNALGDPQGLNLNDKWSILNDRAWYSGIPLMISGTPTGRDKVIYDFILDRGTGPGLPQRTQIENTNGPLNDSKWQDFVAFRGSLIKNAMFRDIGRLRRLDDDSLSTALTKISSEATKKAKRQFRFK